MRISLAFTAGAKANQRAWDLTEPQDYSPTPLQNGALWR
jgi:hypothetical protein